MTELNITGLNSGEENFGPTTMRKIRDFIDMPYLVLFGSLAQFFSREEVIRVDQSTIWACYDVVALGRRQGLLKPAERTNTEYEEMEGACSSLLAQLKNLLRHKSNPGSNSTLAATRPMWSHKYYVIL